MSSPIERVRYFDGEYLRSYDFDAEQAYHREMRRRLNLKLHLYGIAFGLELATDPDSVEGAVQFFVSEGLAIDRYGREIVLDQPFVLRSETVLRKKNIQAGENEIWICYRETAGTLPEGAYRQCNQPNQNTRWREEFDIALVPRAKSVPLKLGEEPASPVTCAGGVRLGTVTIKDEGGFFSLSEARNDQRIYVGIRAGRVVHPAPRTVTFDPLLRNRAPEDDLPEGVVNVSPPLYVRQDVLGAGNAFWGEDFEVKETDRFSTFPKPFPPTGNVKVASNLILRGDLFTPLAGKWYNLADYIRAQLPEILCGTVKVAIPPKAPGRADPSNDTVVETRTSSLPRVGKLEVTASIAGVTLKNREALQSWFSGILNGQPSVQVSASAAKKTGTDNVCDVRLSWSAGPPTSPEHLEDAVTELAELVISYVLVIYPAR
jgi:hypothetical protein